MSQSEPPWHSLDFMSESILAKSLNLATNESDAGSTVLFLHGVLRNWRTFHPLLESLQAETRLAALDFRGHGASEPAPEAYLVRDYVEDAHKALEQVTDRRNIVYGHSLGAMVALAVAAEAPDRVDGLILEDPPFSTMGGRLPDLPLHRFFLGVQECLHDSISPSSLFRGFSEMIVGEDDEGNPVRVQDQRGEAARRFSAESLGRIDPDVLQPIIEGRWLEGYDLESLARRVRCPVVVFQADESVGGMLTDPDAAALRKTWQSQCEWIKLQGVGHTIHWAQPDAILEKIQTLLTREKD